jgi:hypothetical protein
MEHNITLTIDGKIHKLMDGNEPCTKCSLNEVCFNNLNPSIACLAISLGGEYFVELKVEK